jgi:hypothetical protein
MRNDTTMAMTHESSGLLVAFVATAALVLGVVCRNAIVDTLAAVTPPALDSIVLPFAPRPAEVATAPPASPNTKAPVGTSTPVTPTIAARGRTAAAATPRRTTARVVLPRIDTISTVLAAATAPLPRATAATTATTLPAATGEVTRSLAGAVTTAFSPPTTAAGAAYANGGTGNVRTHGATAHARAAHADTSGRHRDHPQHPDHAQHPHGGHRSGR